MDSTTQQAQAAQTDVEKVKAEGQKAGADATRATFAQFKAAFPNDLEFAVSSFETGVTLDQAKAQYSLIEKRTKTTQASTGADGRIGAQAAEGNESADDGPDFMAESRKYAAEHRCSMVEAMQAVRKAQPGLHERFLNAAKAKAKPVTGSVERVR